MAPKRRDPSSVIRTIQEILGHKEVSTTIADRSVIVVFSSKPRVPRWQDRESSCEVAA